MMMEMVMVEESAVVLKDGHPVTTSLKVAEIFGKKHKDVIRAVRKVGCSMAFTERNFAPSEYTDSSGRKLPMYEITKDGFAFLAMGFTGDEAARFKEAYINRFNEMEAMLREGLSATINQVECYWFERRPHWPPIRVRVLAGETYLNIAIALKINRSRVARAVKSMIRVGLLSPAKVSEVQSGPARKAALRYGEGWGQMPLFG